MVVLLGIGLSSPARAATLPEGFEEIVLASGLTLPTAVDFAPDGRIFVAEKAGVVKVVTPASDPEATVVLDISDHVNGYHDRGLLGLAVAHDFAATGHLYLLYTYELDASRQDGRKTSRLTRVTVSPENRVLGKERVILGRDGRKPCKRRSNTQDCIPADGVGHTVGTVRAPADGTLWVGTGESSLLIDPVTSFDAYREDSFAGKLIHVDSNGRGLSGHPFCRDDADLTHVCTKLYAKGFRNPFRFTLADGVPVVGDVGSFRQEEIDVALPGRNYGWPCFEGAYRMPLMVGNPMCQKWFRRKRSSPSALVDPLLAYSSFPGAVVVGPAFSGSSWPAGYRGLLFYGDYARSFINTVDLDTRRVGEFASRLGAPVDIEQTPGGQLAYIDIAAGEVRQIAWAPDNRAPLPRAGADRTFGPLPLSVSFSAAGSSDPEGQPLTYHWSFGDGEVAEGRDVVRVYERSGNFSVRLTATDPGGRASVTLLRISPGNSPPKLALSAPSAGSPYRAGRVLALRAHGSDAQDGELPGRAIAWEAILNHRGHEHFTLTGLTGAVAGFRIPTDHTADSFYTVRVTATDSGGLETTRAVTIRPQTARVRIASVPRGAPVTLGEKALRTPARSVDTVGFETLVAAARSFVRAGRRYAFAGWSDGGSREHVIRVAAGGLRLEARYRRAGSG